MSGPVPKPSVMHIKPYVGGKSTAGPGKPVIKLSSNESPLGPSAAALEAYASVSSSLHRYPDGHALRLREAIAEVQGLEIKNIVCGAGSDELIGLLMHAYGQPGDEMLYSTHGFLMYKIYAHAAGITPVAAPERNLTADVDALLAAVTPRTKLLFIANPNNPTGSLLSAQDMQRLRENLPPHVLLVIDAAYAEYVTAPGYTDGRELVAAGDNTVTLHTFSKIYALPGLRIGWGYMPASVADALNRVRGPFNLSSPAIAAGAAAMRDQAHVRASVEFNTRWRGWLAAELMALGLMVYPSEGNFLLAEFASTGPHTAEAANRYLLSEGIIVREVASYGLPHCLRITIGREDENKALIAALREFLR